MSFKAGERIKNPKVPEWGIGQVLEDCNGSTVTAFFTGAGKKTVSLEHVKVESVEGEEAQHPLLDNLTLIAEEKKQTGFKSFSQLAVDFLQLFPEGFQDKKNDERDYKVAAHELTKELLSKELLSESLENKNFEQICTNAKRSLNKANLAAPFEKMDLKDGLDIDENKEIFATSLYSFLHGEASLENRFNDMATALNKVGAAKWPIISYFPFMMYPDKYVFVKPSITQHAADVCRFEINYKPSLNWLTFNCVQNFADYLKKELENCDNDFLKPRDMIDVQSFMWCTTPGKY